MSQILPIALLGNPVLSAHSLEVADPRDSKIKTLIEDLLATMLHLEAVGLAAPQISASVRVFVMRSRKSVRYPDAPDIAPMAVINPRVISASEKTSRVTEACCSIPGYRAMIRRPVAIKSSWLDQEGKAVEAELYDLAGPVFLHELDHLDGITFLERLESKLDLAAAEEVDRLTE